MEIRDPIHGSIELIPAEVEVLESEAFQRLRSIKQLGFSEYSFPGGTHNRFIHSMGVAHLAGKAFDSIFKDYIFDKSENRWRFRQVLKLAAILHDVGHGPLSHTTEEVMPSLEALKIDIYSDRNLSVKATHEDYTIKFITDSSLTKILHDNFKDIEAKHIVALIDKKISGDDDFFHDGGINFRILLSQIISSEMDVDRMDYLVRDAYFCGTNYGTIERDWLLQNMTYYIADDQAHLALNRRALYTFDDFLLSRHHMHLMVYSHHKSVIYDETLLRYLTSKDCGFFLPADINSYLKYNDSTLSEHLAGSSNRWAKMIATKKPFRMVFEYHVLEKDDRLKKMKARLESEGIESISTSSQVRLSKYHGENLTDSAYKIYVLDQYDKKLKPTSINECTRIFRSYQDTRIIERIYVPPKEYSNAKKLIQEKNL